MLKKFVVMLRSTPKPWIYTGTIKLLLLLLMFFPSLAGADASAFISELKRLEFDTRSIWRVSEINSQYE